MTQIIENSMLMFPENVEQQREDEETIELLGSAKEERAKLLRQQEDIEAQLEDVEDDIRTYEEKLGGSDD